jgi:hypothetical protein
MATPKTWRPEGRPQKVFLKDQDRYPIGMAAGLQFLGVSQRMSYDIASATFYGEECAATKKLRAKRPPGCAHVGYKLPIMISFQGKSSTLLKKSKRASASPEASAWLLNIKMAFAIAFCPNKNAGISRLSSAILTLSGAVGERAFAEEVLLPMLQVKFSSPEFFPRV